MLRPRPGGVNRNVMKKYFLIIVAFSVLDEIKFQLKGSRCHDERDVRNRIADYVEAAGILEELDLSVREVPMPDDTCALYYRNGFADCFDKIDAICDPRGFLLLSEDGKIIRD